MSTLPTLSHGRSLLRARARLAEVTHSLFVRAAIVIWLACCGTSFSLAQVIPQGSGTTLQPPKVIPQQATTETKLGPAGPAGPAGLSGFDPKKAFTHLEKICALGPRISTTQGMLKQQQYIRTEMESLGAKVVLQPFRVRNPLADHNRGAVELELTNMIVKFRPEKKTRLLFCCHYDTRPYPDRDKRNPQGTFIGANDGASGVAVLIELARHLSTVKGPYGIDLVFFDGEEFVYVRPRDPMFLGSTHFANQYVRRQTDFRYAYAILIDMVGDKNLQIFFEKNSLAYAPRLTRSIWGVAQRLKVREFIAKEKYEITDDHLPLNSIARIPTCDIIDFDYPTPRSKNAFWHTEKDIPENCSAESLGKVGKVLLQWIREMQQRNTVPAQR